MSNQHIGSTLSDFLTEQGMLAECQAEAIKRVIAWQLENYIKDTGITKVELAKKLNTSRAALDRLLDEHNTGVTLQSLAKVAEVMNKRLEVSLV